MFPFHPSFQHFFCSTIPFLIILLPAHFHPGIHFFPMPAHSLKFYLLCAAYIPQWTFFPRDLFNDHLILELNKV